MNCTSLRHDLPALGLSAVLYCDVLSMKHSREPTLKSSNNCRSLFLPLHKICISNVFTHVTGDDVTNCSVVSYCVIGMYYTVVKCTIGMYYTVVKCTIGMYYTVVKCTTEMNTFNCW